MCKVLVTDHALVRYLERVYEVDLDKVRCAIADVVREPAKVGAARVVRDGVTYALSKDKGAMVVTTVYK